MKKKLKEALPWVVLALLYAMIPWTMGYYTGLRRNPSARDRDAASGYREEGKAEVSKVEVKTENIKKPKERASRSVGTVTVPIAVRCPRDIAGTFKPSSVADSTRDLAFDGGTDTLRAIVPLTQKEYRDSNYTAYVSGYHASLDSLIIRSKVVTLTRTKYRRWNIGLTGGYGYGFLSKRLEPFVGIGLTMNVFR